MVAESSFGDEKVSKNFRLMKRPEGIGNFSKHFERCFWKF